MAPGSDEEPRAALRSRAMSKRRRPPNAYRQAELATLRSDLARARAEIDCLKQHAARLEANAGRAVDRADQSKVRPR